MPEREFEIYLSVLSRLLRLTPEQTAAVSDELRDHLEERFEELVRSGIARDEAIRQALDEFGDVSGLAVNLTRVSQKPIRRWVIGSSIVSAMALLIAASVFLASDPASRLPGTAPLVAQSPDSSDGASPQPIDLRSLLLDPQPDDLELAQLSNRCAIDIPDGQPLGDALEELASRHGVPIIIDPLVLQDGIISRDTPLDGLSLNLPQDDEDSAQPVAWPHSPVLAQALDLILRSLEMTWYVRDGIITVTILDLEHDWQFPRSYSVRPLIQAGMSPGTLTEILYQTPGTVWEEQDGFGGRVTLVGDVLTVFQSWQAHRRLRRILLKLAAPDEIPWVDYAAEYESLAALLEKPSVAEYPEEISLQDFLADQSRRTGVPILIDSLLLEDGIVSPDEPLNVPTVGTASLGSILRLGLAEVELTLILRDGVPAVTSIDISSDPSAMVTGVYRVDRVLKSGIAPHDLVAALRTSCGGQWHVSEGVGGTATLTENGLLAVNQTRDIHRSIQKLLGLWSRFPQGNVVSGSEDSSAPVTRFYHMPIAAAKSLETVLTDLVAPDSWQSASSPDGGTIRVVALGEPRLLVEPSSEAGDGTAKPGSAKSAQNQQAGLGGGAAPVALAQLGGSAIGSGGGGMGVDGQGDERGNWRFSHMGGPIGVLVITQTPPVHREIEQFLDRLGGFSGRSFFGGDRPAGGLGGGCGGGFF